jgi:hypothetical protein
MLARFERLAFGALTLLARCKRTYCAASLKPSIPRTQLPFPLDAFVPRLVAARYFG